jgi:hypothetical protein
MPAASQPVPAGYNKLSSYRVVMTLRFRCCKYPAACYGYAAKIHCGGDRTGDSSYLLSNGRFPCLKQKTKEQPILAFPVDPVACRVSLDRVEVMCLN